MPVLDIQLSQPGFSRETETKDSYYKALAHMVIKAEKSHDLLTISWKHSEPSDVVSV